MPPFAAEKTTSSPPNPQSPLTPEQQRGFHGLRYFSENPDLRLEVAVEEFPKQDWTTMPTSTGSTQTYRRYGRFRFTVEGQEAELTMYVDDDGGFFLPFVDGLAGTETYAAGRYLEPEPLGEGKFVVDFNLAYNPYCAYNERWSCPVTPYENRLNVPIRAGEKLYAATHADRSGAPQSTD